MTSPIENEVDTPNTAPLSITDIVRDTAVSMFISVICFATMLFLYQVNGMA